MFYLLKLVLHRLCHGEDGWSLAGDPEPATVAVAPQRAVGEATRGEGALVAASVGERDKSAHEHAYHSKISVKETSFPSRILAPEELDF